MMKEESNLNQTDKLFQELDLIVLYNAGLALLSLRVPYLSLSFYLEGEMKRGAAFSLREKGSENRNEKDKENQLLSWSVKS